MLIGIMFHMVVANMQPPRKGIMTEASAHFPKFVL